MINNPGHLNCSTTELLIKPLIGPGWQGFKLVHGIPMVQGIPTACGVPAKTYHTHIYHWERGNPIYKALNYTWIKKPSRSAQPRADRPSHRWQGYHCSGGLNTGSHFGGRQIKKSVKKKCCERWNLTSQILTDVLLLVLIRRPRAYFFSLNVVHP